MREYRISLRDFQLAIAEKYFIGDDLSKATSYYCLYTALQTMGDIESAKQAFMESVIDCNKFNVLFCH